MAVLTCSPSICAGTTVCDKKCARTIASSAHFCWLNVTQRPTVSDSDNTVEKDCREGSSSGAMKQERKHAKANHIQGIGDKNANGRGFSVLNAGRPSIEAMSSDYISSRSTISVSGTPNDTLMARPPRTLGKQLAADAEVSLCSSQAQQAKINIFKAELKVAQAQAACLRLEVNVSEGANAARKASDVTAAGEKAIHSKLVIQSILVPRSQS